MPSATTPATGSSVSAAQVLLQQLFTIRGATGFAVGYGYPEFGPSAAASGTLAVSFRDMTTVPVNGLPRVRVQLFQLPTLEEAGVTYRSRTTIAWRVVARMPSGGTNGDVDGVVSGDWIPLCSPVLLLPEIPVSVDFLTLGATDIAVELRIEDVEDGDDQGADRLVVSITASQ